MRRTGDRTASRRPKQVARVTDARGRRGLDGSVTFEEAFSPARAISHGIEGLKRQPVGIILGGLHRNGPAPGGGGGGSDTASLDDSSMSSEAALALAAVFLAVAVMVLVFSFIGFLIRSWLHTGWIRLHRNLVVTGEATVGTLFSGADAFGRMAGWKVMQAVNVLGTLAAACLPGAILGAVAWYGDQHEVAVGGGAILAALIAIPAMVYVGLGLALGEHAVALEGLGPMGALDRAWELADGHRGALFIYFAATGLFTLLGIFFCCIGVWWTKAIVDVGTTESFLLATRAEADAFALSKLSG